PLIEQGTVMGFHQLIATLKFVIDPTRDVQQALRRHTPIVPKPAIDGDSIFVLEVLHDHVQGSWHRRISCSNRPCSQHSNIWGEHSRVNGARIRTGIYSGLSKPESAAS